MIIITLLFYNKTTSNCVIIDNIMVFGVNVTVAWSLAAVVCVNWFHISTYYEGRPINKLQNGIILLIFKI